jgi:deoxyribodipyrimidine photolyase-related protein
VSKVIWVLNDQCDIESDLLKSCSQEDHVIIVESRQELDLPYTHIKKTALILNVMRHFSHACLQFTPHVHHVTLDACAQHTQLEMMAKVSRQLGIFDVSMMTPKSYHHRETLKGMSEFKFTFFRDNNLISDEWVMWPWFKSKSFRMETFYQRLRISTGLLMDHNGQPLGGAFNFDKHNQNPLKTIPPRHTRISFTLDELTLKTLEEVQQKFSHQLGNLNDFNFAYDTHQARKACDHFIQHLLPYFGHTQDNMIQEDAFVAHSLLSSYLNIGLLNPYEVCRKVHDLVVTQPDIIASAEGFVRQILGWREYMFYKYHTLMPKLLHDANHPTMNPLPALYWGGHTDMNCLHQTIRDSLSHAYSHHIQRLMISSNFANLAYINPYEVHQWFLGIYADAYEWVEIPNTLGMGLYQDQGQIGSKPYVSSAAYINKMSNYCEGCFYNPKELTGERACPFNALYWNYIQDHKDQLKHNPRMNMMVSTYEKFSDVKKENIRNQVESIFERLKKGQL